ncbi:hypothetical protein B9T07_17435 [Limnospira fusiformis CCALA 023]|uniref:hypothetical protein n=2 Tax=Oscillatoriophycideae TaxID=1301283 RepID=UPI00396D3E0A
MKLLLIFLLTSILNFSIFFDLTYLFENHFTDTINDMYIQEKIYNLIDFKSSNISLIDIKKYSKVSKKELLKLSSVFRDIARALGSGFSTKDIFYDKYSEISMTNNEIINILYSASHIKDSQGDWVSLTVGQSLKLITQQLNYLENLESKKTIDLLIKNDTNNHDQQILNVPLDYYCQSILQKLKL